MSKKNKQKTTGATGVNDKSAKAVYPPINHPANCREECPYGYNRAFCFPCYRKIMEEHRAAKGK